MDTDDRFILALRAFVSTAAKGNKAEAARLLSVARPEIYRYLNGVRPHRAKRERLEAQLAGNITTSLEDGGATPGAHLAKRYTDTVNVSELLKSLRFVIHLIEADMEGRLGGGQPAGNAASSARGDDK